MSVLQISRDYAASRVYKNLFFELDKLGCGQVVYVPEQETSRMGKNVFAGKNINFVYSQIIKKYDRYLYFTKIFRAASDIEKRIEFSSIKLIHAHTLFTCGGMCHQIYRKHRIPYIVSIRNTDINGFFKHASHLRWYGWRIIKNASKVIFISNTHKERFLREYIPNSIKDDFLSKVVVVPNGLSEEWYQGAHSRSKNPDRVLKVGFVGRLDHNKNALAAWNAVRLLNEQNCPAVLRIAGDGSCRAELEGKRYLELCGYISSIEKLKAFYDECNIFLLPSLTETFGLVYLEAMSRGLPVLYTKGEGFDGLFPEGEVGYHVDSKNPQDMADKIKLCLSDYIPMSQRCADNIKDFHWSNIARQYQEIYNSVI